MSLGKNLISGIRKKVLEIIIKLVKETRLGKW